MASNFFAHAPQLTKSSALFYCLWLFVIWVSVLDGVLSLRYRHALPSMELNPVGRTLIAANEGRVWYLLCSKFVGTVLACAILLLIHHVRPKVGLIVCFALAAFQLCLLLFLIWGDIIVLWKTVAAEPAASRSESRVASCLAR